MIRRLPIPLATLLVLFMIALPGFAAETGTEEGSDVEIAPISAESGAAIEAPPQDPADDAQPWTVRFVFPLLIALTVVVIGGVAVLYVITIKNRYRVVAE